MKKQLKLLWPAAVIMLTSQPEAFAFQPVESNTGIFKRSGIEVPKIGEKLYRVKTEISNSPLADFVEIDSLSSAIRLLEGNIANSPTVSEQNIDGYLDAVETYIKSNPSVLGVSFKNLKLDDAATVLQKDLGLLKFAVTRNGVEIQEAQVDFRFVNGKLFQIVNESFSEAVVVEDMIDSIQATEFANFIADAKVSQLNTKKYRVEAHNGELKLIPTIKFEASSFAGDYNFEVDLSTVSVREFNNKHMHAQAVVRGFSRTYKDAPLNVYYTDGILFKDNGGTVKTNAAAEVASGDYSYGELNGSAAIVKTKDSSTTLNGKAINTSSEDGSTEYIYNPWKNADEDDTWAAYGTVYANIALIKSLILDSTNGKSLTAWMDKPTLAFVNHNSQCNAFWNGKSVNFFQGSTKCANSGNLGDIVLHEWGHGLDYNTGGIDDGAYSEGFGDLLAYSVYWNSKIGEGLFKGSSKPVRDISEFKSYPKNAGGGVHSEGQIISNTMYDLHQQLIAVSGKENADYKFRSYVYSMIVPTKTYKDVHNYLMSFESDEQTRCLVNKVFNQHGLANERPSCY